MEHHGLRYKVFAYLSAISGLHAYGAIFGILFACGLGLPIPEDVTLLAAGFLASGDNITLWGAILVTFVGVLTGDIILFGIGRRYGRKVFAWPLFRKVFTPDRIKSSTVRIKNHAKMLCFWARFAPGVRSATFLMCGILGVPFSTFIIQDGLAALISVPVIVGAGYWFGNNLEDAFKFAKRLNIGIIVVLSVILIIVAIRAHRAKKAGESA